MKKKGFHFALVFCGFLGIFQFATINSSAKLHSEYAFKQISYEQGLPGNNVSDQIQDRNGIMWFCLNSTGLCRYDGQKFKLYKNDPLNPNSLSNNFVNKIIEDNFGDLWIATDYGLNKFNPTDQVFKVFIHDENDSTSITNDICNSLFLDSKGNIWVGTQNGLSVKEKLATGFKRFFFKNGSNEINSIAVLSIKEQANGVFWIGTNDGLIKFDPTTGQYKKWESKNGSINGPIHNKIADILQYGNYLWLATYDGIDRFNLKTQQFEHWKYKKQDQQDLNKEGICSLLNDKSGNIWAGTFTRGLIVIDPQTLVYQRVYNQSCSDKAIGKDHIRYIYEDNMGLLWIGTKFEGVLKFNENTSVFSQMPAKYACLSPLSNLYILSFVEDSAQFWIGTKLNGLYRVDRQTNSIINYRYQYDDPNSLPTNRIQCMLNDLNNNLWIGAESGLYLMNKAKNTFIKYGGIPVTCIAEDHNGTVWVGTISGVYTVNRSKGSIQRYHTPDNCDFFNHEFFGIIQIYEDRSGTLWFTTEYNGMHSYFPDTDTYLSYPLLNDDNRELGGVFPRSFLEDKKGNFWIGTKSGGLFLLDRDTGKIERYTTQDGLANNVVLCMQEDKNGNIWLGTHNGLSKFNPEKKTFISYNSDYGIKSNICEIAASHKFKSGELLFGGNNGFNIFDPEKIRPNDFVAPLIITSVKVNDKEIARNIESEQEIFLNYKQNVITVEFVLLDYNNPSRHQYSVMMEGVDEKWKLLGNQNNISYANLKPGEYLFQVKGANEFGNWSNTPLKLRINIPAPIYQQIWFKLVSFFILIALILIVAIQIRKRESRLETLINERTRKLKVAYKELLVKNTKIREQNRQIERHQAELEQKVMERTRDLQIAKRKAEESDRLKSSFLANMSHEIRTPLNAITGFSTLVSNDNYSPERKQKYVNIIKTNAASLLKLVEDILDVSRIEAGQLNIKKEFFDFNAMLIEINAIFQEELKIKRDNNVQLICQHLKPTLKSIEFYSDEIRIRQILVNLLSNAIKFTSNGKIELGYELKEAKILFWVKDTGIGIKEKDINSIFNRFTKIEEENAIYRGTGLGLSISQSLVNILEGKIWVESQVNVGSCFYFELPGELKILNNPKTVQVQKLPNNLLNLENRSFLVVEEDRTNFILFQTYLMGTKGRIVWAKNGESALAHLKEESFDLIILDIRSSGIDGYETLKMIRKNNPDIPVIAQTAYAAADEKSKMIASGFNDYIIKPFLKEELFNKLARHL